MSDEAKIVTVEVDRKPGFMKRQQLEKQILLLIDALKEIEWSNDSRWQSDRAKAALAATEPKKKDGEPKEQA
jgi:hypothetical protein